MPLDPLLLHVCLWLQCYIYMYMYYHIAGNFQGTFADFYGQLTNCRSRCAWHSSVYEDTIGKDCHSRGGGDRDR